LIEPIKKIRNREEIKGVPADRLTVVEPAPLGLFMVAEDIMTLGGSEELWYMFEVKDM
jgi:folate-dependent tRNA-U54 methylase TrmFO/GidA